MAASFKDFRMRGNDASLQVIGAGPAGMSVVLTLCNRVAAENEDASCERNLLDSMQIFESANSPGGRMGDYRVNANTSAHDVVQGIADGTPFVEVRDRYLAHAETRSELIPLSRIGELMVEPLAQNMTRFLGSRLHLSTSVERVEMTAGGFLSYDRNDDLLAASENLLLCCGAREVPLPDLLVYRDRWEGSGRFLSRDRLDGLPGDKSLIVIIGASHSAFSCAWRLLHDPLFAGFARDREIVILQRRERVKLRCTPEFAAAHRIDYDPIADVCPQTGLVFFNGGLRKDAKMLYLRIRDGDETRIRLEEMNSLDEKQDLLSCAGLILQATGFVPDLPPIERNGKIVGVGDPTQDGELRDLDSGDIVPGLFGMGLGLNILPEGRPRGEPSFKGGIHGFQSYPLAIAPRVIDKIKANMIAETVK